MKVSRYAFVWGNTEIAAELEGNVIALDRYRDNIWNGRLGMITVVRNCRAACFMCMSDSEKVAELGKQFLNNEFADTFISQAQAVCREQRTLFGTMKATDFSTLSNDELANAYAEVIDGIAKCFTYFRGISPVSMIHLAKILEDAAGPEAQMLLIPTELDDVARESHDWRELLKKSEVDELLLTHVEKYPWLAAYHFTQADVQKTLHQRFAVDLQHGIQIDADQERTKVAAVQERILSAHPHVRSTTELLQKLAVLRMDIKAGWAGSDYYLIPLVGEIAKRTGERIDDLFNYYLSDEIRSLLNGAPLHEEEKRRRNQCWVFYWGSGKLTISSGEEALKTVNAEVGSLLDVEGISELKGAVANRGVVTGVVRILHAGDVSEARDLRDSFRKGEILVTEMTQPSIMDIASKAGGIVTNEGGMLSHAAIISRELGIPCVVGTGKATLVFKNGDKVELDANSGIVRKT